MGKFQNMIKMECRKSMRNKFFYVALGVGLLFALLSALYNIDAYFFSQKEKAGFSVDVNPMNQISGLYNRWIGGESFSMGFVLFFTLFPLLAAFPYGWSQCMEGKSGYTKNVVIRGGKLPYFFAKYIATFLSGGLVVLIPLVCNFLLVACFVPAWKPTIIYTMYYPIHHGSLWSEVFYTYPLVFVLLYLGLDFIFGGLFATMSYGLAAFVKNRVAVVMVPFFCMLGLHYCRTLLVYRVYKEISPLNYLHALCVDNQVEPGIVMAEGLIFFILPFFIIWRAGVRHEIL